MCTKKTKECICEEAVRFTYHNLKEKEFSSIDTMQSASRVLRHYHPELRDEKVNSKLFQILIKEWALKYKKLFDIHYDYLSLGFKIYTTENIFLYLLLIFFISGIVKGIVGMGLPTISLLLLTLFTDISAAISLIIIPSLATNLLQGFIGKYFKELVKEFWIFFIISGLFVYLGTFIFLKINVQISTLLLSILIISYSFIVLTKKNYSINTGNSTLMKISIFSSNGILTGMTGSLIIPVVFYFQSLDFNKEKLIQALGIHFSVLTLFLGLSKSYNNYYLTQDLLFVSFISSIFAFAGMFVGNHIGSKINENLFKTLFMFSLIVLGILLALKIFIY